MASPAHRLWPKQSWARLSPAGTSLRSAFLLDLLAGPLHLPWGSQLQTLERLLLQPGPPSALCRAPQGSPQNSEGPSLEEKSPVPFAWHGGADALGPAFSLPRGLLLHVSPIPGPSPPASDQPGISCLPVQWGKRCCLLGPGSHSTSP